MYFHKKNGMVSNTLAIDRMFNELPEGSYELKAESRDKRTLAQNAFFHAIMPDIQKGLYDVGYRNIKTRHDAKRFVKNLFLRTVEENELTGEKIEVVKDTSELTKKEMREFIDEVIQWAAEYLSLVIYSPNEQSAFNYE